MGIRSGMLVLWLCACGMASNDTSLADGGTGGGGTGGGGGGGINRSGTRIKMKVLNAGDGAKVFQNPYDTQRGEDCLFGLASDGQMRCIPAFNHQIAGVSGSHYADSACTVPVGIADASSAECAAPKYLASVVVVCSSTVRYTLYQRGGEVSPVYSKSGASCTASAPVGFRFYLVGPEIPPSSFQSATPAIE